MGCDRCGSQTPRSRLCAACARHERFGEIAQNQGDDEDDQDGTPVECTVCGVKYLHVDQPCPGCGSRRRRYAGDSTDEWRVEQTGLDGERHTGQATLGGGVAKDGGGDR